MHTVPNKTTTKNKNLKVQLYLLLCILPCLWPISLFAFLGSSSLRAYPLLSVITRQPPNLPPHLSQPSSPGRVPNLTLLSPQHHSRVSEPSHSKTPVSISSESDTEHSTTRLKKPRRSRTIFTELQLMGLEKKFQKQKYLSTPDRSVSYCISPLIGQNESRVWLVTWKKLPPDRSVLYYLSNVIPYFIRWHSSWWKWTNSVKATKLHKT